MAKRYRSTPWVRAPFINSVGQVPFKNPIDLYGYQYISLRLYIECSVGFILVQFTSPLVAFSGLARIEIVCLCGSPGSGHSVTLNAGFAQSLVCELY